MSARVACADVPAEMREVLAACERVTRTQARNFYYGLKLTPEPQRSAMFVIYAWMRAADDLADAEGFAPAERVRRIAAFRVATELALHGRARDAADAAAEAIPPSHGTDPTLLWSGLAWVAGRYNLSAQDFHDMLDGQRTDVDTTTYATWEDLRRFCYRVASTVGLVCIRVWGYTGEDAPALAIDRGIAFQLTNILRDYREDYDMGRIYLPADEFRRLELTPADLRRWTKPDLCHAFITAQCARAEQFYRRSAALEACITPGCVPTLWAMTEIYHGLLGRIAADPAALMRDRRVRLSTMRKAWIAFRARRMTRECAVHAAASEPEA